MSDCQPKPRDAGTSASNSSNSHVNAQSTMAGETDYSGYTNRHRSDSIDRHSEESRLVSTAQVVSPVLGHVPQAPAVQNGMETNLQSQLRDWCSPATSGTGGGYQPNIIIFGETGVGKSSIINLIDDHQSAKTSDSALGCTFQHEVYRIEVDGISCCLWDTTGLDEGTAGTVPAAQAEDSLKLLIQTLSHTGGINLVIYCVRGGRLTSALRRNYDIFYSKVCRKKVPVALIVTHLEHQEGDMETWWNVNEKDLLEQGMRFDAHACITTLYSSQQFVQERRSLSRKLVRDLVVTYSKKPPWRIDEPFMSFILPMLRSLFRPSAQRTVRQVIVYDMAPPHSFGHAERQRPTGHTYKFLHLSVLDASIESQGFAGLLIFYTSPLTNAGISMADAEALKRFHSLAGGQMCPMLIVFRGCNDQEAAQALWDTRCPSLHQIQARPAILPTAAHDLSDELMCMVETEWVEPPSSSLESSWLQRVWTTVVDAVKGVFSPLIDVLCIF